MAKDNNKKYTCDECGKEYSTKGWLEKHLKREHDKELEEDKDSKDKKKDKKKKKTNSSNGSDVLIDETFLDKDGNEVAIDDIIDKDDCWKLKKRNEEHWILTHNAIKKIANIAGISKNFDVKESENINPSYKNELEHIVRLTIHCKAKDGDTDGSCVHDIERHLTATGESNRVSTPHRGRGYLRKMAEKRAFDIAVLEHLGLYSSVFSEEEADEFEKEKEPDLLPGEKEFEAIVPEINALLNAEDNKELKKYGKGIADKNEKGEYSEKQLRYLRSLWRKEYSKHAQDDIGL